MTSSNIFCVVDLETRSRADLTLVGASCYFEDVSTEIIVLGYSIGFNAVQQWRPGQPLPPDLAEAIQNPAVLFVAHNAIFEKSGWRSHMVGIYGWPDIPDERWLDTMATCAYRALPLKLKTAARVLELPTQKGEVPLKYFRPARNGSFLEPGADLYEYNADDVRAEADLLKRIGLPERAELAVWRLDQTINHRGVAIDLAYVSAAQEVIERASHPLREEFASITGGLAVGQTDKVLKWCWNEGALIDNLQAETIKAYLGASIDDVEEDDTEEIREYIGMDLPTSVRRALEIRRILGSASIKKLQRIPYVVGADGRARGLLQYHGATTGRWTGRLLQPQNFPRGTLKGEDGNAPDPELLVAAIMSRDAGLVETLFGNPIAAVASGLRHCLVAGRGKAFVVGDFSTIEARIVLALAGQRDRVKALAAGENLYIPVAEKIYGRPISKKADLQEYTIGKNTVLGCFGPDTLVLTSRGFVPIINVREADKVWDGVEWVGHQGVIDQGSQNAIRLAGVWATPDHKVLVGKQWCQWATLEQNASIMSLALDSGSESLPLLDTRWGSVEVLPGLVFNAGAVPPPPWPSTIFCGRKQLGAISALSGNPPAQENSILAMPMSYPMTATGPDCWTVSRPAYSDATTQRMPLMGITASAVSMFMRHGGKIEKNSYDTSYPYKTGILQSMNLIVSTLTKAMSRVISGLSAGRSTSATNAQLARCNSEYRSLKNVYDIANAGPRNRFTIWTEKGPLIVHNCGFQMGWEKFQNRYAKDKSEEFCREVVRIYRQDFAPHVPELWEGLGNAALRSVQSGRPHDHAGILYERKDRWLTARLPSGRRLWYFNPQLKKKAMPWSTPEKPDIREVFTYQTMKSGQWRTVDAYGGSLTANVVQATARDLLVASLFKCEAENMPVVLTVHDEAVCEVPSGQADEKMLEQIMCDVPGWAKQLGVPVAAETWCGSRYRK